MYGEAMISIGAPQCRHAKVGLRHRRSGAVICRKTRAEFGREVYGKSTGVWKRDDMYTLYYSPGTASMCVHQALIEANAQYRLVLVDLQAGQQRDPVYLQLNPGGVVPTLLID